MPMITKLVRVVTYCKELPPINSNDSSMRWFCEVTWQIKYISTCKRPMETKLGEILTYWKRSLEVNYQFGYFYLHFRKSYGHLTWQGVDFGEEFQHTNA